MGLRKYSKRYAEPVLDLNTAPEWYRQEVAAAQRASVKQQKRRHTQSVLDAVLTGSGWNAPDAVCGTSRTGRSATGVPPSGDDCITQGMPRPADDRNESDESSDDDTDQDEVRRSIQESLAEARKVL